MHSSLVVQCNSLVSQRAECGTLYFLLDSRETFNIPRFSSSSHFRLISLKGIQNFPLFFSLSVVLSSEHSGRCYSLVLKYYPVSLWLYFSCLCSSNSSWVSVIPCFCCVGKVREGCINVCWGRERLRFSVSWLNGLLQWSGCMKKSFFHFCVLFKEKSDLSSALEVIQTLTTRK